MLTELRLSHFKNHTDTVLTDLRRLSVIVGPNGVGKSSVLEAMYDLHLLGALPPSKVFDPSGAAAPGRIARGEGTSFQVHAFGTTADRPWDVDLRYALDNGAWKDSVSIAWEGGGGPVEYGPTGLLNVPDWLKQGLRTALLFRLEPSALRAPSYPAVLPPRMDADGYGLPSVVSYLMRTDPAAHRQLTERLREVVPPVLDLRANPVEIPLRKRRQLRIDDRVVPFDTEDTVVGDELLFDTIDGRGIPGSSQSDGTLLALGVLTALSMPNQAKVILLDDLETGVHPAAQRHLVRVLRKLLEVDPELQIIATTHSPYILDELGPDEVWVLGRSSEGVVGAKRLADHPKAEDALRVLTTGELWSVGSSLP